MYNKMWKRAMRVFIMKSNDLFPVLLFFSGLSKRSIESSIHSEDRSDDDDDDDYKHKKGMRRIFWSLCVSILYNI